MVLRYGLSLFALCCWCTKRNALFIFPGSGQGSGTAPLPLSRVCQHPQTPRFYMPESMAQQVNEMLDRSPLRNSFLLCQNLVQRGLHDTLARHITEKAHHEIDPGYSDEDSIIIHLFTCPPSTRHAPTEPRMHRTQIAGGGRIDVLGIVVHVVASREFVVEA